MLAFAPGLGCAQANGAAVVHGQASFSTIGNQLVITTRNGAGTQHSAIDWQQFSVPQGGITRFNQPDAASTSINRVLGNNPSLILGTLSSNGKLVLVNPSGITVGAGAVVDTSGFTASTLRMSDADALAGRLRFDGGSAGALLRVDGRMTAQVGDVVLIGSSVAVGSTGLAYAPNGAVVLAAGQKVELTGRGLEGIRMEVTAPSDSALNLGTLQGDAVGIFAATLRHSGIIRADGAGADDKKLRLVATKSLSIDGETWMGKVLVPADDGGKADKDKKDKEDKNDKADKQKDTDGGGADGGDGGPAAATAPQAAPLSASPAATASALPAPVSTSASGSTSASAPASGSASAPAGSPGAVTAPAPAALQGSFGAFGTASTASAATPGNDAQQSAASAPGNAVAQAASEQEKQMISFLSSAMPSAASESTALRKKKPADRDALQCTP